MTQQLKTVKGLDCSAQIHLSFNVTQHLCQSEKKNKKILLSVDIAWVLLNIQPMAWQMCHTILGRFRIKYRCNLQFQLPRHPLRLFLPLNRKHRPKIISNPRHSNNIITELKTEHFSPWCWNEPGTLLWLNTSRLMVCVITTDSQSVHKICISEKETQEIYPEF